MQKRPKGITLLIIWFSFMAVMYAFLAFSTERAGDLVEQTYGDKLKIWGFFDYDKKLAIALAGVDGVIALALVVLMINRSRFGRLGLIGYSAYGIAMVAVSFLLPPTFFPEDHPYYPMHVSVSDDVFFAIVDALIILYMFRPKVKEYFASKAIEKYHDI